MILLLQTTAAGAQAPSALAVLSALVDRILDYGILLAAVGAVSMALLEVVKKLFDFRARFHAERWTDFMVWNGYTRSKKLDDTDAYVQLLQLASGVGGREASHAVNELTGDAKPHPRPRIDRRTAQLEDQNSGARRAPVIPAFWGQPKPAYSVFAQSTAQLTSTLGDAADVILASPHAYPALFTFFVGGARNEDIERWMAFTHEGAVTGNALETPEEKKSRALGQKESAAALSRLRQLSKRRLAAFQLFTEQSWASWNQLWANFVGVIVMGIVLINLDLPTIQTLVGALFGGLLAPVAKDLVDALQRVKADIKDA